MIGTNFPLYNMCKNNKSNKNGFTLLELLVGLVIFTIFISSAMGIFISVLRYQREVLAKQELLNQTSYAIEYMSRALRMAKKDVTGYCITFNKNYEPTKGGKGIKFINHMQSDECQEFFLEDGQLKHWKETGIDGEVILDLTAVKFKVTKLKFEAFGESSSDELQPRVTILLEAQSGEGKEAQEIRVQTTVSQRNLDVVYE